VQKGSVSSSAPWNKTGVSTILGIEYPIIQGPLGGLSTQRLTATVSNFGGLGSFGAHGLVPSAIMRVQALLAGKSSHEALSILLDI
jgi:nitronate monooxygenase